jgi:hypothetical protein
MAAYGYLPACLSHALLKNYWKVEKLQPHLIPLRNRLRVYAIVERHLMSDHSRQPVTKKQAYFCDLMFK